jgi:hypothetical protein
MVKNLDPIGYELKGKKPVIVGLPKKGKPMTLWAYL